jgi:alpha-glucosidase (family GH31 glycosyl hydrolase)
VVADFFEHMSVDYSNNRSKPEAIFQGKTYRITVLSERLVRLEYHQDGIFFDDLTEQVINRNFSVPEFQVKQDEKFLEIKTKYFHLQYVKEKPFQGTKFAPDANLKVTLVNTDRIWYFGHPEARNFGTSGMSLDENSQKVSLAKGLYSVDGFVSLDDANSLVLMPDGYLLANQVPRVDTYLFVYRRDFGLCLKDYFTLTGYPSLIPRYALGIWWNRNEIYHFQDTKDLLVNFNRNKIPLSILLLGEFWHLKDKNNLALYKTGFTFNRNLFPDPSYFTNYMHERGIHIGVNIDPKEGIMPHEDAYDEIARNLGLSDRHTIPFNVFDKFVLINYFNFLINPLMQKGVDFFWIDYYVPKDPFSLRALSYYHFQDFRKYKDKRGLVMGRNGGVCAHRYPILFSGETTVSWGTLKILPYYNSLASNKGISWWSHDVGGYKDGVEDAELYVRYVQLGCFSPIFRFASKEGRYYKREPWRWDVKTLTIVRDYCTLRHRLIPYLYGEAYKYHKTGLPLIEPLYYLNPEIYDEVEYRNEYYFGTELFVAPITVKKDLVMNRAITRIFLPEGTWYDFKTGKKFPGNKRYVVFYKDEDYPVFAHKGSIIPLADLEENINVTNPPKSMEIHVFPGNSNTYYLYEDDGASSLYEDGYYIMTTIDYNYLQNNYTLIIRPVEGKSGIIPPLRDYRIRFRNTREADDVKVYLDKDLISSESYVEDEDFIVVIKDVRTTSQLTINCKGKDIEIDAVRILNEDIDSIISDLQIETRLKEEIARIMYSDLDVKKKRIQIKKLKGKGLEPIFIRMFMKLLELFSEL